MIDQQGRGNNICVTTHVARDLLQNAAVFNNEQKVVWEYVSNGLEYVDEGTNPVVQVILESKKKRMVIKDNGRGMDWTGLQNFFIMHGENIDRKHGKRGRGRFGTGKSAAFGIGLLLRVTTVKEGILSKVELHRNAIKAVTSEDPIPVKSIEREKVTVEPNGTVVEIEQIRLKSLDQDRIIQYIERHLAHWRNASVYVNNHECHFSEPPLADIRTFRPEGRQKEIIGDVELTIKIASTPLDKDFRGVSIYSNDIWHEITLAGNEGREMSQYIFGEIDVPLLDEDESPIPPFDLSRSMQLNPSNELVQAIKAFIGQKIDLVRRELVRDERQRKASEEAKRLAKQAQAIAQVINEDFDDFRQRVAKVKAKTGQGFDLGRTEEKGGTDEGSLAPGSKVPAEEIAPTGSVGSNGGSRSGGTEPRALEPIIDPAPGGEKKGQPAGSRSRHRTPRGGFNVQFKSMGQDANRAIYSTDERTIYVNLDHPQLVAARGESSTEDPVFLRLAYEVSFSEYAVALAYELNENDQFIDLSDPIWEIRDTINRIARKAAHLYAIQ